LSGAFWRKKESGREEAEKSSEEAMVAVAVEIHFPGTSLEQYDQVVKAMGFVPKGPGEPGLLFHWVAEAGGGLRIVDVWETQEQFERFAREKMGPLTAEAGFGAESHFNVFEVHNYLVGNR